MIKLILSVLILIPAGMAGAQSKNRVHQVKIEGNKMITDEAIQEQIQIKKGQRYYKKLVEEDVKNLFNIGYFDNIFVRLTRGKRGLIVTYHVKEKPRIESVEYSGNDVLSLKKLEELSSLKEYEFLSIQKIKKSIESIKKGYEEKGYFLTDVSYKVQNIKATDKVKLVIHIKESSKTLIKRISFVGNNKISDKRIKSFLSNKEDSMLSFLTNSSVYTREKLKRDQQVIRFLYLEEGYLEMKLGEPEVTLSPDKAGLYISFPISEGEQFRVGRVDYAGDLIFSKVELREGQRLKEGDLFSYSRLQGDLSRIQTKYGDEGYAFSNVVPGFQSQDGVLHVVFNIQKGEPIKIRYINISGNQFTRDKVLRRLLTIDEGDLYNASEILKSKNSMQRLGYFDRIDFFNQPIIGRDDQIDLEISLKERESYGIFQAGGGYASSGGLMLTAKLSQENLMGYGTTVGLQVNILTQQKQFVLDASYLDPYFLDTDFYFGINIFSFVTGGVIWDTMGSVFSKKDDSKQKTKTPAPPTVLPVNQEFAKNQWGGNITTGRWLSDTTKVLSKFGFEQVDFSAVSDPNIFDVTETSGLRSTVRLSLDYDNRDDRLLPKKGIASNFALEYTYQLRNTYKKPPLSFTKVDAWMSHYTDFKSMLSFVRLSQWDLLEEVVLKNRLQYGRLSLLSQQGQLPFDKLYLLGGPLNLRGFRMFSVGPRKKSVIKTRLEETRLAETSEISADETLAQETGVEEEALPPPEEKVEEESVVIYRPYGGAQQWFYNLELKFPLLLQSKIFGIVFFDIGNTADTFKDLLKARASVGAGLFWMSPLGPLHLKIGFPFKTIKTYNESPYEFHFNIGFDF